ncbi:alanine--tRNA ligase [Candidatus Nanohalococcus occultus]|uniref:Alanine--tRNA ligase n=1 Tax=Candidatus Nanohalococcus occultus TaxID=2978047 RepID=A0ABY8CD53_9ARCH|nr:Alanyl-tRNA synthetase [Candidatus Nanohaloarchaeota archaeon SVXNc]
MSLSELKKEIKQEASENPEKFFATDILKEKGFSRGKCTNCGMRFWSFNEDREVCGEPECSGGYTFINDSPTEKSFGYIEAWERFRDFMADRGYTPIDRYPVVARWRDDVEFVGGSIYNFQPYVVSGEAEPPAPELVVPQPSLRFNDVDNVGITGRHYVLHNHIGQTCFREADEYDQDRYFKDMFEFAVQGLGIPKEKLILHEDSWGGGGNLGACMEFFVDGLELWNQVYMFYEQTPDGYEELDLKVLDMGMGQERITWISHGTETSYECVMPETVEKLKERTGLETDDEVWEKFLPYSSELNVDEVEDIEEKWVEIAEEIDEDVDELKKAIKPAAALYSIAEHTRALIFALADGKIPSNTGGGHNLRMIYRRAKDFIEKYDWDIDLVEVARWNAEELEPMFPELLDSMDEIEEILDVEERKYEKAREKAQEELGKLDGQPTVEEMIELYESHGVSPEMMESAGYKVPEDFYAMLGGSEEVVKEIEEGFDLEGVEDTEKLYYENNEPYRQNGTEHFDFKAEVLKVIDEWIVLDRTMFYPEGGGQLHDVGKINNFQVKDVQKQNGVILHKAPDHELSEGKTVKGVVNGFKRKQLTQHHTATHVVNAAAREQLGEHIYQSGASKTLEKGRLDITHYEKLTQETLDSIESKVQTAVSEDHKVNVLEMSKAEAEKKYGFRIYQGGAPPGNNIRLIEIEDLDIEACGGTHLTTTSHIEEFYITNSRRIQDGVIRLEYKAGEAARDYMKEVESRIDDVAGLVGVETVSDQMLGGTYRETERKLCELLSVEPDQLMNSIERFKNDNSNLKERIEKLSDFIGEDRKPAETETGTVFKRVESLFSAWRENEKTVEELETGIEGEVRSRMEDRVVETEVPTENVGLLIQVAQKLSSGFEASVTLIGEKGAVSASYHEDYDADENLEKYSENIQGDESFAKAFDV